MAVRIGACPTTPQTARRVPRSRVAPGRRALAQRRTRQTRPAPAARRAAWRSQRGSGTVIAAALSLIGLLLALAVVALGHAAAERATAQAAADLAALGAAQHVLDGGAASAACDIARQVAQRNGATLESCAPLSGERVRVSTSRALSFPRFARSLTARAVAVAGPRT